MRGVLDRFEGDNAVILVEENKEEFLVKKGELPAASEPGVWFHLSHNQHGYTISSIDVSKTEEKSSANALLLERLRSKKKESSFKRKED